MVYNYLLKKYPSHFADESPRCNFTGYASEARDVERHDFVSSVSSVFSWLSASTIARPQEKRRSRKRICAWLSRPSSRVACLKYALISSSILPLDWHPIHYIFLYLKCFSIFLLYYNLFIFRFLKPLSLVDWRFLEAQWQLAIRQIGHRNREDLPVTSKSTSMHVKLVYSPFMQEYFGCFSHRRHRSSTTSYARGNSKSWFCQAMKSGVTEFITVSSNYREKRTLRPRIKGKN